MRTIQIDLAGVNSADEVWQRYLDDVQPAGAAFFGRNLDAFWDAVEAGGPGWPGDVKLVFVNTSALVGLRLRNGLSFLDAFRRIAHEVTPTSIELR